MESTPLKSKAGKKKKKPALRQIADFQELLYYERKLKTEGFRIIIGVDEAGRGPLAGPVTAAAVALKTYRFKNRIDDSKKLTSQAREVAFSELAQKSVFGIGIVDEKIIDQINILEATRLAMKEALNNLISKLSTSVLRRAYIIVDGNMSLDIDLPFTSIIHGDAKSMSIAGASILAKVTRDRIMDLYDRLYPQYGFIRHKGYPTKAHKQALKKFGPSLIHRISFCHV